MITLGPAYHYKQKWDHNGKAVVVLNGREFKITSGVQIPPFTKKGWYSARDSAGQEVALSRKFSALLKKLNREYPK